MFVIGGIDDQINSIVWAQISNSLFLVDNPAITQHLPYLTMFHVFLYPHLSNQPILWGILSVGLSLFDVAFFNVFVVFGILLALTFSYLLFRPFKYSLFYVLVFTFSSYTWSHLGRHISISQIWLVPLFFYLLSKVLKLKKLLHYVLLGLFLVFSTLISNYLGFFLLLTFGIYSVLDALCPYVRYKKVNLGVLKAFTISTFVFTLVLIPTLKDYFVVNYLGSEDMQSVDVMYIDRGIEDFATFSSRPWYIFMPSEKNPVLGGLGGFLIGMFDSWDYFLADDYFPGEHTSNFFGLTFLFAILVSLVLVLRNNIKKGINGGIFYYILAGVVFSFMLPPFFTVSGLKIFTPGFLIFKLFPMFRVTARLSIVVLQLLLLGFAHIITSLAESFPKYTFRLRGLMGLLLIMTMVETFVPFKVTRLSEPPKVYGYLKTAPIEYSQFVIYPYNSTEEALLWLPIHERLLVNPRLYSHKGFDSERFTKSLVTEEGLKSFSTLSGTYLVVSDLVSEEDKKFFDESSLITQVYAVDGYFVYAPVDPLQN